MYRTEKIAGKRISIEEYLDQYVDVPGFLEYCKECEHYGRYWSCPPYDFEPEDYWRQYKYLYVIGSKIIFDEKTRRQLTGKAERGKYIRGVLLKEKLALSKSLLAVEEAYPGSVSLAAGGTCEICSKCSRETGKPCVDPDSIRYSIESLGGNVGKTVSKLLQIELQWMDEKLPEFFTLVSGFLSNDPDVEL